jgi:hypothetical protein
MYPNERRALKPLKYFKAASVEAANYLPLFPSLTYF